jgi:hypothetical protein
VPPATPPESRVQASRMWSCVSRFVRVPGIKRHLYAIDVSSSHPTFVQNATFLQRAC